MAEFTKANYKTISLQDMAEYIEANAPKDKAWFKAIAFEPRKKKVAVEVKDGEGNPVRYQVMTKEGKPKLDKRGNPVYRNKIKMIETADGEEKSVFNLLKAKREFYSRYFPNELPTAEKKIKPTDILNDW